MLTTYKHKKITWIDLESPTAGEVESVMKKYEIHPLVAEELLRPTLRPKTDAYKNFVYLVLHFPVFDEERKGSVAAEVDFIAGKNFFITVHYKPVPLIYELGKSFEVNTLADESAAKNPGALMCSVVRQFYGLALRQLNHIEKKLDDIEDNLFKGEGKEYEMVEAISYVRRDTLDFRKAIHQHKNILNEFGPLGAKFFSDDFSHYVNSVKGDLYNVDNILSNCEDTTTSIQSTNDSLLANRANETMKTLNTLAFLTFPLMLFAALFSMDTVHAPIIGLPGDFWIIIALMIVSMSGMILVFKRKKWL